MAIANTKNTDFAMRTKLLRVNSRFGESGPPLAQSITQSRSQSIDEPDTAVEERASAPPTGIYVSYRPRRPQAKDWRQFEEITKHCTL
jgi:hypothetical protein